MSTRPLTRRDFDDVIRRAAELAAGEAEGSEAALNDKEVVRIGQEVGLAEHHIRRALAEHRAAAGVRAKRPGSGLAGLAGGGTVLASRSIERPPNQLVRELDEFMVAGQLLQRVRRKNNLLQYRPAVDWASRVARAASATSSQHHVAAARMVEVRLEDMGQESTLVQIQVDPGIIANYRAGVLGGGVVGVAAGAGAGLAMASLVPVLFAIGAGVLAGAASWLTIALASGRGFRRRIGEVHSELEGILDGLESGSGLEPPPPAWRRWVRRHFHGVAREMKGPAKE